MELREFYNKIYLQVGIGLFLSFIVSYITANMFTNVLIQLLMNKWFFIFICIIELGMVISCNYLIMKVNPIVKYVYYLYCLVSGFTLSTIFLLYTQNSIINIFLITSILFLVLSFIGTKTERDLSSLNKFLLMSLLGIIIASIINLFLRNNIFDFIITIVGIIVFSGLIIVDNKKIKDFYYKHNVSIENNEVDCFVFSMALQLYLDFINLFLKLLRILGKKK